MPAASLRGRSLATALPGATAGPARLADPVAASAWTALVAGGALGGVGERLVGGAKDGYPAAVGVAAPMPALNLGFGGPGESDGAVLDPAALGLPVAEAEAAPAPTGSAVGQAVNDLALALAAQLAITPEPRATTPHPGATLEATPKAEAAAADPGETALPAPGPIRPLAPGPVPTPLGALGPDLADFAPARSTVRTEGPRVTLPRPWERPAPEGNTPRREGAGQRADSRSVTPAAPEPGKARAPEPTITAEPPPPEAPLDPSPPSPPTAEPPRQQAPATLRTSGGEAARVDAPAPRDPDPLPPAHVRLTAPKRARFSVAMDDGSRVEARVRVEDRHVDVQFRAPPEAATLLRQGQSELRESLHRGALDLGSFDVSDAPGGDGDDGAAAPWENEDGSAGEENVAVAAEPATPFIDDERGALLARTI